MTQTLSTKLSSMAITLSPNHFTLIAKLQAPEPVQGPPETARSRDRSPSPDAVHPAFRVLPTTEADEENFLKHFGGVEEKKQKELLTFALGIRASCIDAYTWNSLNSSHQGRGYGEKFLNRKITEGVEIQANGKESKSKAAKPKWPRSKNDMGGYISHAFYMAVQPYMFRSL